MPSVPTMPFVGSLLRFALSVLVGGFTAIPAVAATNLLANPGAETGDFSGWETAGTPADQPLVDPTTHIPSPVNHEGAHRFGISVGWATADCSQSQSVAVVPGHAHAVALWYTMRDGTDEALTVTWHDAGGGDQTLYDVEGARSEWTRLDGSTFVPAASVGTLTIRYRHRYATNIASIHVDEIELTDLDAPDRPGPLTNGGFEGAFVDGVGEGWNPFRIRQGGFFKANERLGRLGGGIYGCSESHPDPDYDCMDEYQSVRMSAKTYLVDASRYDLIGLFNEKLGPEVLVIGKIGPETVHHIYPDGDTWQHNAEEDGRRFADYLYETWITTNPGFEADAYYCLNEPSANVVENLRKVCKFELGFTRRMHEMGYRSCVLNNSVGTPAPLENILIDEVRELFAEADYVGYHAYGWWGPGWMCPPEADPYTYRWQTIAQWYSERGWRFPPVLYTEGGQYWWVGDKTPQEIIDDLTCYERRSRTEEFWSVGLHYFVTGAWPGAWDEMHLARFPEIIDACRDVNQEHPVDAHGGIRSQEMGGTREPFDLGVVHRVGTAPGAVYRFSGWFRHEYEEGWPNQAWIRVGWDPTGQDTDPLAPTVAWSDDLVALGPNNPVWDGPWETDIWYRYETPFRALGTEASVWIRASQRRNITSSRVYADDLELVPSPTESDGGMDLY